MGEFERGTEYATKALSQLSDSEAAGWARAQSDRIGLSFGGQFNSAIKSVLSARGIWPEVQ